MHEIVVFRAFNDDIGYTLALFGSKVTDMALTHPPLTYVGSRSGQVKFRSVTSGDLLKFDFPAVIFGPEFESDGQIKLGHLVY